jgi:signal transduction histidine kinase
MPFARMFGEFLDRRLDRSRALSLLLFTGLIAAASWASAELTFATGSATVLRFTAALAVAWTLKAPRRDFSVLIAASTLTNIAVALAIGVAPAIAVITSLNIGFEVALVVVLLRRFAGNGDFTQPRSLAAFYLVAIGPAAMLPALAAACALYLVAGGSFALAASTLYVGGTLSLVILVPPLVMASLREFASMFARPRRLGTLAGFVGIVLPVVLATAFPDYPISLLFFPAVLLLTFTRGPTGGSIGIVAACLCMLLPVLLGDSGPMRAYGKAEQLTIVLCVGAVLSLTMILTTVALAARQRLERGLADALAHAEHAREEAMLAKNMAETANRTKSMFLANMSHELRTPLNAIIGFSEIMQSEMFGALGDTRYTDYTNMIHDAGAHLLELINDILDMSKIEAGKFEIERKRLDLREVTGDCLALMEGRAAAAGIELKSDLPSTPVWLDGDRRALKQILLNLLSNAVKFTPAGGSVSVWMGDGDARRSGRACLLSVQDTGIGIPQEAIKRLGSPFVQLRDGADRAHQGTGLGLALVRALAEMHDGAIRIDSVLGAGTTVTLELPVEAAAVRAA